MLTLKYRSKVAPNINIKISPNDPLLRLGWEFKIVYERSKAMFNFLPSPLSFV